MTRQVPKLTSFSLAVYPSSLPARK